MAQFSVGKNVVATAATLWEVDIVSWLGSFTVRNADNTAILHEENSNRLLDTEAAALQHAESRARLYIQQLDDQ
jgi:hypothetical protein